MRRFQIRYITLIAILLFFAAIIFGIQRRLPAGKANVDISRIPLDIGEWIGEEIPVEQKTKDILETESVLIRKYTKENNSAWLAIVYYKDSRVALHLPESCYVGQGSQIVKRELESIGLVGIDNFQANKFILQGDKSNQVVFYYFETNGIKTGSYQAMRWQMMLNKLKSKSNSGALVRFSALVGQNSEETTKMLKEFIKEISPLLSQYLI